MTAIERTAYPRFTHVSSVKELRDIYTFYRWVLKEDFTNRSSHVGE
ncbi:hypothetical protein [Tengunoibacter tsumagoiensis]|uniref:Uncharacterized protein n=1 Tax=Tengunoibacter tsumagoiensis TaxID=2014871 RepID=A0A402A823_9CHLR|nr:hypothetical protein [Tengunoibacter tsumagoiensis]GCE15238.1 hypothetical protein KTT_50970 [Tengunoibacter tsumagoiensis]